MSEEKNNEWDSLWQEYTKSLEKLKSLFLSKFKMPVMTCNQSSTKFGEKATVESSTDTMKLFGENWQKAMTDAGMKSFKD